MIRIPYNDMIAKIKEKASLSEEDVQKKVDKKLEQLSGLISKEGAAHIIANELGVKLVECSGKIKDIYPGMRNCEVNGKVQQIYGVREFTRQDGSGGKVGNILVGDETGVMRVVFWGDHADTVSDLSPGTIIRVTGAMARENQGRTELHLGDNSKVVLNPNGVQIDEVKQRPSASRKEIKELAEGDQNIEILGTIVQMFDPKFYEVCPQCNARVKEEEGKFECKNHGNITPTYSYIVNTFLDDGTENIRCVFFANQVEKLLGKNKEQMLSYRESPESFEPLKTEFLGQIVKLIGRVRKNPFFDRIEFNVQLVFPNPDPEEELKRLKKNDG